MLRNTLVAVILLAFAPAQAASVTAEDFRVRTTGDLIRLCSASADDPLYPAARGFCLGYLDAAHDYHAALTAGKSFSPIACPEGEVTRDQVVEVVVEWAGDNRNMLDREGAMHGVMRAVAIEWPCRGE